MSYKFAQNYFINCVIVHFVFLNACHFNIDSQNMDNDKSIHDAIRYQDLNTVKNFIQQSASNIEIRDNNNCTPVHTAVIYGQLNIVQYLVEQAKCNTFTTRTSFNYT